MGGCFFVKSGPFLNTGSIMYSISIFYFTFYLFGGAYAPNAPLPPAYGPGRPAQNSEPAMTACSRRMTEQIDRQTN